MHSKSSHSRLDPRNLKRHGATDDEILQDYPSLAMPDLAAAWKYYGRNTEEIDHAIREDEADDQDDEDAMG